MADGGKSTGGTSPNWRTVTLPSGRKVTVAVVKKSAEKSEARGKEK